MESLNQEEIARMQRSAEEGVELNNLRVYHVEPQTFANVMESGSYYVENGRYYLFDSNRLTFELNSRKQKIILEAVRSTVLYAKLSNGNWGILELRLKLGKDKRLEKSNCEVDSLQQIYTVFNKLSEMAACRRDNDNELNVDNLLGNIAAKLCSWFNRLIQNN